jgi:hypothetical protein
MFESRREAWPVPKARRDDPLRSDGSGQWPSLARADADDAEPFHLEARDFNRVRL